MGKYFGTDGVRGIANTQLSAELAYKIGRCGGYVLTRQAQKPRVFIGRDTRRSGPMLEAALTAGLLSIGVDVIRLGVVTTPGVAYLTRILGADAGVMISASHNSFEDNGIKFFGGDGFKLSDDTELEIEQLIDTEVDTLPRPTGADLGQVLDDTEARFRYIDYLATTVQSSFAGLKIVVDCANGAAYELAPLLLQKMGAEIISIGVEPDGININEDCGSTHPEKLQAEVLLHGADLGLSFDGDADRLIAIDETGEVIDGDYILAICGDAMNRKGSLQHGTLVTTVMANIGFFMGIEQAGMSAVKSAVGDRYVMEEMRKGGYNLGGEQSGHVIFLDYNTTGDGMVTALQLVDTIVQSGRKLSELKKVIRKYPQVLVNVKVVDKERWAQNKAIMEAIHRVEQQLDGQGRLLVRPSGTESLIRVMAEGPDPDQVRAFVDEISQVIEEELA